MARTKPYNQDCPIARTLDIIGDRWTLLIIRDLFFGRTRFSQLRHSTPSPPPKLLAERLKRLEQQGLVERAVYSQYPLRAEYQLTAKGRSLFPVLHAIGAWGAEHLFEDEPELLQSVEQFIALNVPEYRTMQDMEAAQRKGD